MTFPNFNFARVAAVAALIFLAGEKSAFAYIDPNSGSLFLQLILGGIAGMGILLRIFWKKIVDFFKK